MKRALICLFTLTLAACNPFPKDEDETAQPSKGAPTSATTPTPTPIPKPGAWMTEKRDNPLGIKTNPLDQKPRR